MINICGIIIGNLPHVMNSFRFGKGKQVQKKEMLLFYLEFFMLCITAKE